MGHTKLSFFGFCSVRNAMLIPIYSLLTNQTRFWTSVFYVCLVSVESGIRRLKSQLYYMR